jgi:hypothetical protein
MEDGSTLSKGEYSASTSDVEVADDSDVKLNRLEERRVGDLRGIMSRGLPASSRCCCVGVVGRECWYEEERELGYPIVTRGLFMSLRRQRSEQ